MPGGSGFADDRGNDSGDDSGAGAPELIEPEDFLPPNPFPVDAQRLGIDRWTGDNGALIALAASLDRAKPSHRVVAWLLLLVVLTPVALDLWRLLG
ncbi:MAG TPA: hypothetical protein VI452_05330 [Marmoricola sp.]